MRTLEHIGSDDMLLFSTDYPHWQFDGDDVLPDGLPADAMSGGSWSTIRSETYPRLREAAQIGDNAATQKETVR